MELRDIWRKNLTALVDDLAPGEGRGVKRPAFKKIAEAIERDEEYVYQLYRGLKRMSPELAQAIDRTFARGRAPGWFNAVASHESQASLDRPVSQRHVTIVQEEPDVLAVEWGDMDALRRCTGRFTVIAPDDSMHDRVKQGKVLEFDRRLKPTPGDGVLVADRFGDWYFRIYRAGPQGTFEAYPLNPAYRTLESARDGLEVLAVLSSSGRWGG